MVDSNSRIVTTPAYHPARRHWPLMVGVATTLMACLAVWSVIYFAQAKGQLEYRARTQETLMRIRDRLDRELQSVLAVPETVAAFVAVQGKLDPALFAAVVSRLVDSNKHIRNVALAPDNVIETVYPLAGNEQVIGLRYMDTPAQSAAVRRAIETRRTVVAGPFKLVQGGLGISSRTPVFRSVQMADGGQPYWGIVSLTVNAESLFADVGLQDDQQGFDIAARGSDARGSHGPVFVGSQRVFARDAVVFDYPLPGGGSWQLGAVPRDGWSRVGQMPTMVVLFAYTMALLVGLLSYRLMVSRQRILALAVHDRLTGLPNRRLFEDRLSQAVSAARRHRRIGALLLLDLDRFKPVNDTFGHRSGDQVLMRAAQRLGGLVRGSDSVSRLGGDEFAIILHEIGSSEEALRFGERAVEAFSEPFQLEKGATAEVGLSVGIAIFSPEQEVEALSALFDRADRALYQSKKRGGSSFTLDRAAAVDQPAANGQV